MQLYFIAKSGEHNLDCFVIANDGDEAERIWREQDWVAEFLEDDEQPDWIFVVPAYVRHQDAAIGPRALEWHKDVDAL